MEVVYLLGKGSPFNNEELRYSLRSLYHFGQNVSKVIIVGEKPDFLDYSLITHIPFKEEGPKDYRIAKKIEHVCREGIVSGDFLFMNDDFFFLKPFDAANFPFFHKGPLLIGEPKTAYQHQLKITRDYLIEKNKPTNHFDVHTPIVYNSENFLKLSSIWEESKKTHGFVVKSIYANWFNITGTTYHDIKLKQLVTATDHNRLRNAFMFSIYDAAWKTGVYAFLQKKFPNPSKYEL